MLIFHQIADQWSRWISAARLFLWTFVRNLSSAKCWVPNNKILGYVQVMFQKLKVHWFISMQSSYLHLFQPFSYSSFNISPSNVHSSVTTAVSTFKSQPTFELSNRHPTTRTPLPPSQLNAYKMFWSSTLKHKFNKLIVELAWINKPERMDVM